MTVTEILPNLKNLNRADKIRAVQFLVNEIAKEENLFEDEKSFPVWSPYDSFEASDKLLEMLKTETRDG